jgi:hypothetical protein
MCADKESYLSASAQGLCITTVATLGVENGLGHVYCHRCSGQYHLVLQARLLFSVLPTITIRIAPSAPSISSRSVSSRALSRVDGRCKIDVSYSVSPSGLRQVQVSYK